MRASLPFLLTALLIGCDSEPEPKTPDKPGTREARKETPDESQSSSKGSGDAPRPTPSSSPSGIPLPSVTPPPAPTNPVTTPAGTAEEPPAPAPYRTAVPIPGKPGYVFNPWINTEVDVRGVPPGTLVRDPRDPDPKRKFRIP